MCLLAQANNERGIKNKVLLSLVDQKLFYYSQISNNITRWDCNTSSIPNFNTAKAFASFSSSSKPKGYKTGHQ